MAGEFGELIGLDFGSLDTGGGDVGVGNLDVGTTMPAGGGGLDFGQLASGIGGGLKAGLGGVADVAKGISPLVGLGTAGMGLAAGIQGAKTNAANVKTQREALALQKSVAANQAAAAAPLTQFGQEELKLAQAGQVPPAVQAEIDQLVAGYKQKINDFAARSGQGDSSMVQAWLDWADKQGLALKSAWIQQQQAQGVSALSAGASAFGGAGQTAGNIQTGATNQSAQIQALLEQSNKALASLTAGAS